MKINKLNPRKALNKAFFKVKPNRVDIERFKANLIQLPDGTNDTESEEFHKNLVPDFIGARSQALLAAEPKSAMLRPMPRAKNPRPDKPIKRPANADKLLKTFFGPVVQ